jgi:hypothetical protein
MRKFQWRVAAPDGRLGIQGIVQTKFSTPLVPSESLIVVGSEANPMVGERNQPSLGTVLRTLAWGKEMM